jgi:uncharacterized protein YndB with AHSA1/START domain
MPSPTTERIERTITLRHPRSKVWRALTDLKELNAWAGIQFEEPFAPGARRRGVFTAPGFEGGSMEIVLDRIEPERLISWRWHPGAPAPGSSPPDEEMTLVVFELSDAPGGTLLTVTETGFERIPIAKRAKTVQENTEGWEMQLQAIAGHLDAAA